MAEELLPDSEENTENSTQPVNKPEDQIGDLHEPSKHRRKRRVRKRIRIKKKPNKKKKIKKLAERIIWILFIAGFIYTIIELMKQLDIQDERSRKKKKGTYLNLPPIRSLSAAKVDNKNMIFYFDNKNKPNL